jgi:hypothetical protein
VTLPSCDLPCGDHAVNAVTLVPGSHVHEHADEGQEGSPRP